MKLFNNSKITLLHHDVITKEDNKIYRLNTAQSNKITKHLKFLDSKITKKIHSEKLGPGRYRSISPYPQSPSFERSSRFHSGIQEKYLSRNCKQTHLSEIDKEKIKERMKNHQQSLGIYKMLFTDESYTRINRAKKVKECGVANYKKTISKRKEKIIDKTRKSEIIINKTESLSLKKSWIILLLAVNASSALKNTYISKSNFKRRVEKVYSFFFSCSRFIGKILILRRKLKIRKAYRLIKIFFIPKIKEKLKTTKQLFSKRISQSFQRISSELYFSTLQNFWRLKRVLIQKTVKNFMKCRYATYLSLIVMWQRNFKQFTKYDDDHKKKIPFLTQVYFLRKYINKHIKDYISTAYAPIVYRKLSIESEEYHRISNKLVAYKLYSCKAQFKEFVLDVYGMKNKWDKINMQEYAYWRNYKSHPLETYLRSTRFRKEHEKKRSIIMLLNQYIL